MKKDLKVLAVIIFLLIVVIRGTKIQSVEDYYPHAKMVFAKILATNMLMILVLNYK